MVFGWLCGCIRGKSIIGLIDLRFVIGERCGNILTEKECSGLMEWLGIILIFVFFIAMYIVLAMYVFNYKKISYSDVGSSIRFLVQNYSSESFLEFSDLRKRKWLRIVVDKPADQGKIVSVAISRDFYDRIDENDRKNMFSDGVISVDDDIEFVRVCTLPTSLGFENDLIEILNEILMSHGRDLKEKACMRIRGKRVYQLPLRPSL